jgi:hypothetical protein
MGSVVGDPAEQAVAAAAINTVQLMCGAFGAGLAGVVVNLHDVPDAITARWTFGVFAALAALTWVASSRAARPRAAAAGTVPYSRRPNGGGSCAGDGHREGEGPS